MKPISPGILALLSFVSASAAYSHEHSAASEEARHIRGERQLFFLGGTCSQDLACSGFLGFGGYQLRSGYFDQCQGKCSLFFLAPWEIWFGGFECGVCGGANEVALKSSTVVDRSDVEFLASDELEGRGDNTLGGKMAIEYIVDELVAMGALGLNDVGNAAGRDTYVQKFYYCSTGSVPCPESRVNTSNVVAYIPGSELPNEYVMLGAHHDHLTFDDPYCRNVTNSGSKFCNGAMDNAAGVAVVLGVGRALAALVTKPRRSVILAFWGAEEAGLFGSRAFITLPSLTVRPLNQIVAYINYDIAGSNLSPSLREVTLAVGPETGGSVMQKVVTDAAANTDGLQLFTASAILSQGRSDHANFLRANVPSVHFTDANNGCYHTTGDETKNVDFSKLEKQGQIGLKVAYELATRTSKPTFSTSLIPVSFSDVQTLSKMSNLLRPNDLALFSDEDQEIVLGVQATLNKIVAWGPLFFLLFLGEFETAARDTVDVFSRIQCDGFLAEN